MNVKCVLSFFSLLLVIEGGFSPVWAMNDKEQRGFKRTYQQTQVHDQKPDAIKLDKTPVRRRFSSQAARISTPENHLKFLQDGISTATKSILITSYGVDDDVFKTGNLYRLLEEARQRSVRIYIYNIDSKEINEKTFHFFERTNIAYDVAYTHAKIFAIDEKKVAIGSYNWLSNANDWENATLCLSGKECFELIHLIWGDLRYYRNLQFGNFRQIKEYEDDPQNDDIDTWDLDSKTSIHYIHSLEAHRDFIEETFKSAIRKVILCSPFINPDSGYQKDFTKELLSRVLRKGVHLYFICRTEDLNLSLFKDYLGSLLNSPFMHLITMSNIHLKTLIADDEIIAEGSFNWLSASRDEDSDHHNHEVTLVLDGDEAKIPLQDFYASLIGQEVAKFSEKAEISSKSESKLFIDKAPESTISPSVQGDNCVDVHTQQPLKSENINWKISVRGNAYINVSKGIFDQKEHHAVIIKGRSDSYSAIIDKVSLKKWYASEKQAKSAVIDTLKSVAHL